MLGKTRRTNRRLQAQVETILEQRDQAIKERDAAVRLNGRLCNELEESAARSAKAWRRVAHDATTAEGLFTRSVTLMRRREQRHQATVAGLRRELSAAQAAAARQKERADALAERVHALTTANQAADWAKPAIVPAAA